MTTYDRAHALLRTAHHCDLYVALYDVLRYARGHDESGVYIDPVWLAGLIADTLEDCARFRQKTSDD